MKQAKTEQLAESARNTAHSLADKADNATQNAQQSVQENKDQLNPGFLQQVIYYRNFVKNIQNLKIYM